MPKKKHTGRPSKYRDDFPEVAAGMCRMGATDKDLAKAFGVSESTLNDWKKKFPEFSESLKEGKDHADAMVENALFKRATGYDYEEVEEVAGKSPKGQTVRRKKIVRKVAPDVTAIIFWLKNRKRAEWRDVRSNEITGQDGAPLKTENVVVYIPSNGRVCTNEGE